MSSGGTVGESRAESVQGAVSTLMTKTVPLKEPPPACPALAGAMPPLPLTCHHCTCGSCGGVTQGPRLTVMPPPQSFPASIIFQHYIPCHCSRLHTTDEASGLKLGECRVIPGFEYSSHPGALAQKVATSTGLLISTPPLCPALGQPDEQVYHGNLPNGAPAFSP